MVDTSSAVAAGGQGTVVRVINTATGERGALKRLHPALLSSTERRLRMAREVAALEAVSGAGVPRVLEHNMDQAVERGGSLYVITEWVEGIPLNQYVSGRPRPLEEALRLTRELASILSRCHLREVYHRDIKPDNVLIEPRSLGLTLVDFGISWCSPTGAATELNTEFGQELGNRFLRIPDLAAGRERRDPRADVTMSVGMLFYLLTGQTPRVLADEALRPPHVALAERIPEAVVSDPRWTPVRRVFDVGFQPSVDLRFQTADELIQRLNEILEPARRDKSPLRSEEEVQTFNELLASAITASKLRIEEAMLVSSRHLEQQLRQTAERYGLLSIHNAGWAWVSVPGKRVEFTYSLVRRDARQPEARVHHVVELVGSGSGQVQARYSFDDEEAIIYYIGPAADTERLAEELEQQSDEIFAAAVARLREKLINALG